MRTYPFGAGSENRTRVSTHHVALLVHSTNPANLSNTRRFDTESFYIRRTSPAASSVSLPVNESLGNALPQVGIAPTYEVIKNSADSEPAAEKC